MDLNLLLDGGAALLVIATGVGFGVLRLRSRAKPAPAPVAGADLPVQVVDAGPKVCEHLPRFGGREEVAGKYFTIAVCDKCGQSWRLGET